jgi:hypothetical protein
MGNSQNKTLFNKNIIYESFIRRCYDCKRYEYDVDATDWDDLHSNYLKLIYADKIDNSEAGNKYLEKIAEIKNYLDKAYENLLMRMNKLNENNILIDLTDIAKITEHKILVKNSINHEEINDILGKSIEIMNNYKYFIITV